MENHDKPFSVEMTAYERTTKVSFDYPDVNINEVIQAIVGCLVGLTWDKEQIIQGMKDYIEE